MYSQQDLVNCAKKKSSMQICTVLSILARLECILKLPPPSELDLCFNQWFTYLICFVYLCHHLGNFYQTTWVCNRVYDKKVNFWNSNQPRPVVLIWQIWPLRINYPQDLVRLENLWKRHVILICVQNLLFLLINNSFIFYTSCRKCFPSVPQ